MSQSNHRLVVLLSGGKDSIYSALVATQHGHSLVALANLHTLHGTDDDSFMYQTAGAEVVPAIATCMGLPLYRRALVGSAVDTNLRYAPSPQDEVEDMFLLLGQVQAEHPEITAVCCGAILSTYQRHRVESVCARLGLVSMAPLWAREQKPLLEEMLQANVRAVLVKVATMGLNKSHLNKSLSELHAKFEALEREFGFHFCGEGGEYETIVLDCPLYTHGRLVFDEVRVDVLRDAAFAPTCRLVVEKLHVDAPHVGLGRVLDARVAAAAAAASPMAAPSRLGAGVKPASLASACAKVFGRPDDKARFCGPISGPDLRACLTQMERDLAQHGRTLADVGFCFLAVHDMSEFAHLNAVYSAFFAKHPSPPPSRATIELDVEGVAIMAVVKRTDKEVLQVCSLSFWAPLCIGPYAQCCVLDHDVALVAGQIGLDPFTMTLAPDLPHELGLCMRHCDQILKDAHVCAATFKDSALCLVVYVSTARDDARCDELLTEVHRLLRAEHDVSMDCLLLAVAGLPRNASVEVEVLGRVPRRGDRAGDGARSEVLVGLAEDCTGLHLAASGGLVKMFFAQKSTDLPSAKHAFDSLGPEWAVWGVPVQQLALMRGGALIRTNEAACVWTRPQ
jgi:diphthine-ammonia ligase